MKHLNNIRIVLVAPTHPGNIGAVARAMKTMGLTQLYLVNPKHFPDPQAIDRAAHATDILDNAVVVDNLVTAINDCHLVFGTSARDRTLPWPEAALRIAATQAIQQTQHDHQIAFVFGREHAGLTNEELALCHGQIHIPANPEYSSLNLAAAVQVVCYEIRMAYLSDNTKENIIHDELINVEQLEGFYSHLENVLLQLDFIGDKDPSHVMTRLRRLFSRTKIETKELNILRGMLTAVERKVL